MRVLVVDDVPSMRHFLVMCLAELNECTIDQAGDGLEALKLATQSFYDVILLDLNLPLMDGFRVLSALRSQQEEKRSAVAIITTSDEEEVRRRASELDAVCLFKPVKAHEVRDRVRELLGISSPKTLHTERRRHPRLRIRVQVEFYGTEVRELVSEDINALGAFLLSDVLEPVGSLGKVVLHLPHLEEAISVDCRVVHVRPTETGPLKMGFGVRFEPATAELSTQLSRAFVSPPP